MKHECDKERELDIILSKIDKLDEKMDSILAFKWQIMGGSAIIGIIITAVYSAIFGG